MMIEHGKSTQNLFPNQPVEVGLQKGSDGFYDPNASIAHEKPATSKPEIAPTNIPESNEKQKSRLVQFGKTATAASLIAVSAYGIGHVGINFGGVSAYEKFNGSRNIGVDKYVEDLLETTADILRIER